VSTFKEVYPEFSGAELGFRNRKWVSKDFGYGIGLGWVKFGVLG